MQFDVEHLQALQKYEGIFRTAINEDFTRNIVSDKMNEMISIWEQASGQKVLERMSCGACQLNFIKRLGKAYFDAMDKVAKELEPYDTDEYAVPFLGRQVAKKSVRYMNPITKKFVSEEKAKEMMEKGEEVRIVDRTAIIRNGKMVGMGNNKKG